jgi:CheY-like chemotaxis protein
MALILVVEDSPLQSRHLCDLLKAAGHTTLTAANGMAALEVMKGTKPDVVVSDMIMPEMNGIELTRHFRARHPATPVLVVTEHGSEELAVEALRAGAANYLPKRNLTRDLVPVLEELLCVASAQMQQLNVLKRLTGVELRFELDNDPGLVAGVVSQVEQVMRQLDLFEETDRMQVGVAVHEAAVNAIVHGNLEVDSDLKRDDWAKYHEAIADRARMPPYSTRRVRTTVRAERNTELSVCIADQGPGFDPTKLPDPTDPENLMKGCGRGMLLIRTFFDDVRHNSTGNEITMVKRVTPKVSQG